MKLKPVNDKIVVKPIADEHKEEVTAAGLILPDTAKINPMGIFKSFMQDAEPVCKEITRQTINAKNKVSTESRHVPLDEILKDYKEGFYKENSVFSTENIYLLVVGILFLYILSKLYYKNVKIL